MPRNQPTVPRSVPGPLSMPRMRSTVNHHASAARANNTAISPSRARAAAKTGRSPSADAVTRSGDPRELRRAKAGFSLVFDAEQTDVGRFRFGNTEFRAGGMEDAGDT